MTTETKVVGICTADLYDEFHENVEVCTLQFRSFGRLVSFFRTCGDARLIRGPYTGTQRNLREWRRASLGGRWRGVLASRPDG